MTKTCAEGVAGLPERFYRISPLYGLAALAADWALILAAFALAVVVAHPVAAIVAALLIARSQLALAVILHESAHGVLLPGRRANDLVGQWFAAGPLFLSLRDYRAGHLKHHRAPMAPDDPVAVVFAIDDYPQPRRRLLARLFADLCGLAYLVSAWRLARGRYRDILPKGDKSPIWRLGEVASMFLANALIFAALYWSGRPGLYPALWLLPAVTLLPFFGRIRAIMEHAGLPACTDQAQNARTIVRPSWQTFFCGPHAIHYHIEHHLHVRVPFYHLPALHERLRAAGRLPQARLYRGYGAILREVSRV